MSEVDGRTDSATVVTQLIPDMNFTCNASIVGFISAGVNLNREPNPKIQIWRKNSSQPTIYYKTEPDVVVNTADACVETGSVVGNVVWCILDNTYRVSVQPGDIVGVELPSTTSDEIYFTHGGPTNYIFQRQLDSTFDLSLNESVVQQLPQIALSLTSGKSIYACLP